MALADSVTDHLKQYFASCEGNVSCGDGLYHVVLREIERPLFEETLLLTLGNRSKAANLLGLSRNTFRKKMIELGLDQ